MDELSKVQGEDEVILTGPAKFRASWIRLRAGLFSAFGLVKEESGPEPAFSFTNRMCVRNGSEVFGVPSKGSIQCGLEAGGRLVSQMKDGFVDVGAGVMCVADAGRSINRLDVRID